MPVRRTTAKLAAIAVLLGATAGLPTVAAADGAIANAYYEQASRRVDDGDTDAAVIELKNALQADPEHVPSLSLIGRLYLDQGIPDAAEDALRDALRLGADPERMRLLLAQALLAQRKDSRLVAEIQVDGLSPSVRAQVHAFRAQAFMRMNQPEKAEQELIAAEVTGSSDVEPRLVEVTLALRRGNIERAEQKAAELLLMAPERGDVWNAAASVSHARGRWEEAIERYGLALDRSPRLADARLARLTLLFDLDRDEEAADDLAWFAEEQPMDPRGNYMRALRFARAGDDIGANTMLAETIRVLGMFDEETVLGNPQLLAVAALAHHAQGNMAQAVVYLTELVEANPGDSDNRKLLADALLRQGNTADAVKALTPALIRRRGAADVSLLTLASRAYSANGDYQRAAEYLQEAVTARPDDQQLRARLSRLRISTGDVRNELPVLSRIVAENPAMLDSGIALVVTLQKEGRLDDAQAQVAQLAERFPADMTVRNLVGVTHFLRREWAPARAVFEGILADYPQHRPALVNLGKLDLAEGRLREARNRFRDLLQLAPDDARLLLEASRVEVAANNNRQALVLAEKAWAADPANADVLGHLVRLLVAEGSGELAVARAWESDRVAPEDLAVSSHVARVLINTGDREAAKSVLRNMVEAAAFDAGWLVRIASMQDGIGQHKDAEYTLYKAIQGQPEFLRAHLGLVEQMLKQGKHAEALGAADNVVRLFPDAAQAQVLRGEALLGRGRAADALAAFDGAVAAGAGNWAVLRGHHALVLLGDIDGAEARLRNGLERFPDDEMLLRALGDLLLQRGREREALVAYTRLDADGDAPVPVLNNLAWLRDQLGEPGAEALARRAVAAAPEDASVNDTLGWILVRQGRPEDALRYLREASARDFSNPTIRYHLGVCLMDMGRMNEARRELTLALESGVEFAGREAARERLMRLIDTQASR